MKKISMILFISAMLFTTACSNTTENSSSSSLSSSSSSSEPEKESPEHYIADQMYYTSESDYEFVMLRCGDIFLSPSAPYDNYWTDVYNVPNDIKMKNGEFVLITADVTFLDGGESGYRHEPEIKEVKKIEKIGLNDVCQKYDIPQAPEEWDKYNQLTVFSYDPPLYVFRDYKTYYVFEDGKEINVFTEEEDLLQYDILFPKD